MAERLSYDVWGKRRNVNGTDAAITATQNRGYTGHEHLDAVSLIHMNGRVYEPNLGRFTGADPIVHAAGDGQSYNRYAYVRSNPLRYTDPSGFDFWSDLGDAIEGSPVHQWHLRQPHRVDTFLKNYGETIVVVVLAAAITYASAGVLTEVAGVMISDVAVAGVAGKVGAAAVGGYAAGYMSSGGDPRAAATSALSAALFAYAGAGFTEGSFGQYPAHAVAGCASSRAQGGSCAQGAAAGVAGKFVTLNVPPAWGVYGQVAGTVIAGGTASSIMGGHFANGAVTAAFGYLFNHWLSNQLALRNEGNEAHKSLQAYEVQFGYGAESSYVNGVQMSRGRLDLFNPDSFPTEFWEIKRFSIFGIASGYSDIHWYASNSNGQLIPGGNLPSLSVGGETLTLRGVSGSGNYYTYRNEGGGLITYSTQRPPTPSVRVPMPFTPPVRKRDPLTY